MNRQISFGYEYFGVNPSNGNLCANGALVQGNIPTQSICSL
jgi:hypothetical protein